MAKGQGSGAAARFRWHGLPRVISAFEENCSPNVFGAPALSSELQPQLVQPCSSERVKTEGDDKRAQRAVLLLSGNVF